MKNNNQTAREPVRWMEAGAMAKFWTLLFWGNYAVIVIGSVAVIIKLW